MRLLGHKKLQRGDTSLTAILALALLAGAAVATGGIVKFMRTESQFSHVTGTALSFESFLLSALQRPETYSAATAESLRKGETPAHLQLKMDRNGTPVTIAAIGKSLYFNELGKPCTGPSCALRTDLSVKCASSLCHAAYRIEINAAATKSALPSLGAAHWPPQPEDFSQVISYALYKQQGAHAQCAATDLFVAGISRDTGAVHCVRSTTRKLSSNEIAKGVSFSAGTNSLELKTVSLKKGVCPPKYLAQKLRPQSLETTPDGTCVYRYKKEVPWMKPWPTNRESVSERFCPAQDYKAVGTGNCTMSIVSTTHGYCSQTCKGKDGKFYECGYSVAPNTAHSIHQSVSGPNASCSLKKTGTQSCGASWTGAVHWSGTCKITVPETQAMGGE